MPHFFFVKPSKKVWFSRKQPSNKNFCLGYTISSSLRERLVIVSIHGKKRALIIPMEVGRNASSVCLVDFEVERPRGGRGWNFWDTLQGVEVLVVVVVGDGGRFNKGLHRSVQQVLQHHDGVHHHGGGDDNDSLGQQAASSVRGLKKRCLGDESPWNQPSFPIKFDLELWRTCLRFVIFDVIKWCSGSHFILWSIFLRSQDTNKRLI